MSPTVRTRAGVWRMTEPIGGSSALFGRDGTELPDPLPVLPDVLTGPGPAEAVPASPGPGPVEPPAVDPEMREAIAAALDEDVSQEQAPPQRTASHRTASHRPAPARPPQRSTPPDRHHQGPPDWRHGAPQLAPPMDRGLPRVPGAPPMGSPPTIQPPLTGPTTQTGSGGQFAARGPGDSARRYRRASAVPSRSRAPARSAGLSCC